MRDDIRVYLSDHLQSDADRNEKAGALKGEINPKNLAH